MTDDRGQEDINMYIILCTKIKYTSAMKLWIVSVLVSILFSIYSKL